MIVIGLTGRTGSGKSTVGYFYKSLGAEYIDTDKTSREVCIPDSPCLNELVSCFGKGILNPDGSLNRKRLGEIALGDGILYDKLNEITHRHILERVRREIKEAKVKGAEIVVVDAPMLFESGFERECDVIIGVVANETDSINRVAVRDGIDAAAAKKRLEKQKSQDFIKENCRFIIENNSTVSELEAKAKDIFDKIRGKA